MTQAQNKINKTKIYTPHAEFKLFMKNFLQFLRKEELSESAGEKGKNLRRMKNYYLNEHLFPSMANVVFFFETVSLHHELEEEFELDIKDLLGIRRINPKANNYAYVFQALVHSIIYTKKGYKNNNFRLRLILELQRMIRQRLLNLTVGAFENDNVAKYINEDIDRAETWTELVAAKVDEEYDFQAPKSRLNPPSRSLIFDVE